LVQTGRGRAQGRAARGTWLHRVRAGERHRLPHLHGHGAGPVRFAVLRLPARSDAEAATGGANQLPQGRVPGLSAAGDRRRPGVTALAARSQTAILLLAGAAGAWALSVERMRGMDA